MQCRDLWSYWRMHVSTTVHFMLWDRGGSQEHKKDKDGRSGEGQTVPMIIFINSLMKRLRCVCQQSCRLWINGCLSCRCNATVNTHRHREYNSERWAGEFLYSRWHHKDLLMGRNYIIYLPVLIVGDVIIALNYWIIQTLNYYYTLTRKSTLILGNSLTFIMAWIPTMC